MKRIFGPHAYGPGPVRANFWGESVPDAALRRPAPTGQAVADVAVIGAGFTGLSAALHLAQAGADVAVIDAEHPGWGASGRNGGFCCLGGAKADDDAIRRSVGDEGLADWHRTEAEAIALVDDLLTRHGIDADRHSRGETLLAHSPRAMRDIAAEADTIRRTRGVEPELHGPGDLSRLGMAGPFHGGITLPVGFALNPRKYLAGLLRAAETSGARVYGESPAQGIASDGDGLRISLPGGASLHARRLILATNGYSSEDIPSWMAGRYLPAQSNVIVTRPLTGAEQAAAGWTSAQMAFDSRTLLHYFRLMPDGRFLFGRRGGLLSSPAADAAADRTTRAHFRAMFPAWAGVEITHGWCGMVCLAPDLVPYCGPIPGLPGAFAGFAYHGNGVAMGTHTGALLADLALGRPPARRYPALMQTPPGRFPLGRLRRALLPAAYALAALRDRL